MGMMWWPPYRRRIVAEADELMEYYGDQAKNAATRLSLSTHRNGYYRKSRFYKQIGRYLEKFDDLPQAPYIAETEDLLTEVLDRISSSKTLH